MTAIFQKWPCVLSSIAILFNLIICAVDDDDDDRRNLSNQLILEGGDAFSLQGISVDELQRPCNAQKDDTLARENRARYLERLAQQEEYANKKQIAQDQENTWAARSKKQDNFQESRLKLENEAERLYNSSETLAPIEAVSHDKNDRESFGTRECNTEALPFGREKFHDSQEEADDIFQFSLEQQPSSILNNARIQGSNKRNPYYSDTTATPMAETSPRRHPFKFDGQLMKKPSPARPIQEMPPKNQTSRLDYNFQNCRMSPKTEFQFSSGSPANLRPQKQWNLSALISSNEIASEGKSDGFSKSSSGTTQNSPNLERGPSDDANYEFQFESLFYNDEDSDEGLPIDQIDDTCQGAEVTTSRSSLYRKSIPNCTETHPCNNSYYGNLDLDGTSLCFSLNSMKEARHYLENWIPNNDTKDGFQNGSLRYTHLLGHGPTSRVPCTKPSFQ